MTRVETAAELREELQKIEEWENEQKDLWFWEKLGRLPFVLLDKVIPSVIHRKLGVMIDEVGDFIQTGGQYLINENRVIKKYIVKGYLPTEAQGKIDDIKTVSLYHMDNIADEIRREKRNVAAVQGATTGIGGVFTLSIDIPLLLGISFNVLQEIALAYGFNPKDQKERVFIVKCLQFTSSDIVGKKSILDELSSFQTGNENKQMMSQLQGWREVFVTYRDTFGWKKLFQMIPIAGVLFGAFINRSTISDVAEVGKMLYRKRRIMERLEDTVN